MQCKKCGYNFEGNFCPNCGEKAEVVLSTCPNCGKEKEENVRFCANCGYNYESKTTTTEKTEPVQNVVKQENETSVSTDSKKTNLKGLLFKILYFAPAVAILVLSLFAILGLCMPYVEESFMGEVFFSYSGFSFLGEDELMIGLSGVVTGILLVSVVGLLFGGYYLYFRFKNKYVEKEINVSNKSIKLNYIFAGCAGLLDLILIIMLIVANSTISSYFEGELGGASGIMFPLVFAFILAIPLFSPLISNILVKKVPGFKEEVGVLENKTKASKVKKEEFIPEGLTKPTPVANPKYERGGEAVDMINRFTRKKMRLWFFQLWLVVVFLELIFTALVISNYDLDALSNYSFSTHLVQVVIFALLAVFEFVAGYVLIGTYRLKKWDERKSYKLWSIRLARATILILFAMDIYFVFEFAINGSNSASDILIGVASASCVYILFGLFIYSFTFGKLAKKIRIELYGKPKVKADDPLVVTFDELNKSYLDYLQYKQELKEYNYKVKCYKTGKTPKDENNKKSFKLSDNVIKICSTAIVSLILFCLIPLTALGYNKFSISNLKVIEINSSTTNKSTVKSIFGTPDVGEDEDLAWYYYENSYLNILNKLENLDERMESVTSFSELESLEAEYEELEEQLDSLTYKSLNINFNDNDRVLSLWLNATTTSSYSSSNDKTLSSYNVIEKSFSRSYYLDSTIYNLTATIVYEATYTDGSYTKASTTITQDVLYETTSIEVEWSDRRGDFEATLEL